MCFSGVKLNLKDRESYNYIEEEPMGKKSSQTETFSPNVGSVIVQNSFYYIEKEYMCPLTNCTVKKIQAQNVYFGIYGNSEIAILMKLPEQTKILPSQSKLITY